MNPTDTESVPEAITCEVKLPAGILGFEQEKNYLLIANPSEKPFRWLQVQNNPALAFVVIEPFLIVPDYQPDIPQADVEFLGLSSPQDAAVLNIVTIHGHQRATINLKGPVVINRNTGVGKQVILTNAGEYSVQHPIPQTNDTD